MVKDSEFDKPFLDFPDLISLLESRGLQITNESNAIDLLKTYGYYPVVNGFKKSFQSDPEREIYTQGVQIEQLFSEFIIDSQFQEILLNSILPIENHFKNMLGYLVAKNFGVNNFKRTDPKNPDTSVPGYLEYSNYYNSGKVKAMDTINFIRDNVITSKDKPISYYRKKKNHIPPWILCENMMFGTSIRYYQILPERLKNELVNELINPKIDENLDNKKALLLIELEILRCFRNAAAHSAPLYLLRVNQDNNPSPKTLRFYLGKSCLTNSEAKRGIGTKDLYSALLALIILTKNSGLRFNIIQKIKLVRDTYSQDDTYFNSYNHYLKMANLPENFVERLDATNNYLNEK